MPYKFHLYLIIIYHIFLTFTFFVTYELKIKDCFIDIEEGAELKWGRSDKDYPSPCHVEHRGVQNILFAYIFLI